MPTFGKTNERFEPQVGYDFHAIVLTRHEHDRYVIDLRREDGTVQ